MGLPSRVTARLKIRCQEPAYKFDVESSSEEFRPPRPPSAKRDRLQEQTMATPKEIDVVRRAYELWQQAGQPPGKDEEFYHQAKKELQDALDNECPAGDN